MTRTKWTVSMVKKEVKRLGIEITDPIDSETLSKYARKIRAKLRREGTSVKSKTRKSSKKTSSLDDKAIRQIWRSTTRSIAEKESIETLIVREAIPLDKIMKEVDFSGVEKSKERKHLRNFFRASWVEWKDFIS